MYNFNLKGLNVQGGGHSWGGMGCCCCCCCWPQKNPNTCNLSMNICKTLYIYIYIYNLGCAPPDWEETVPSLKDWTEVIQQDKDTIICCCIWGAAGRVACCLPAASGVQQAEWSCCLHKNEGMPSCRYGQPAPLDDDDDDDEGSIKN